MSVDLQRSISSSWKSTELGISHIIRLLSLLGVYYRDTQESEEELTSSNLSSKKWNLTPWQSTFTAVLRGKGPLKTTCHLSSWVPASTFYSSLCICTSWLLLPHSLSFLSSFQVCVCFCNSPLAAFSPCAPIAGPEHLIWAGIWSGGYISRDSTSLRHSIGADFLIRTPLQAGKSLPTLYPLFLSPTPISPGYSVLKASPESYLTSHTNRKDSKGTAPLTFLKLYSKLYHCLNGPIFYSLKDSILSLTCLWNASSLTMEFSRKREEKGALNLL